MRVVVTGGAGFIGSHVVEALLDAGHEVVVVDDLSIGHRANLEGALRRGGVLHEADVTDSRRVRALLARERPHAVVHLAARIDAPGSVADPVGDARVNVLGTAAVLEAARVAGAGRVILASTGGALYGDAATIPTAEQAPLAPLSPYGMGKAAAEGYVALYERLHGLSAVCLRLANVYGPRQKARAEGGVIARFCMAARTGRPVTVFGDGRQTRDFVYVQDVARAFAAAVRFDVRGAVNIGTGTETSVLELATLLGVPTACAAARAGEVRRSCLDCTRAADALAWRPVMSLPDGLARTLDARESRPPHAGAARRIGRGGWIRSAVARHRYGYGAGGWHGGR